MDKMTQILDIPSIKNDTNFWMVRAKRGFFFDEFIRNEFIAIGWNSVTKAMISQNLTRMISAKKPMPESVSHDVRESILDTYVLEFLDLPEQFSEKNLRKAIIENLKQFILEFGRDFTFIGEEYRVQVGNTDFFIDLLFYNRALSCLVPIELKIGKFKPEHIGQINFYLEALDRDVKKPNENPSVGVILCASKDDAVVEYALSRSMSPTLVADYRLCLPDKTLLQNKLRELTELALESGEGNEGDDE